MNAPEVIIPGIALLPEKKIVGMRRIMSFAEYNIGELWQRFAPRKSEVKNAITKDLLSVVIYKPNHFEDFKPTNEFERWAAVEVSDFDHVPEEMETFVLRSGLYAIFHYQGLNTDNSIFQYIFGKWLPNSEYELDNRPHFEVLGEKYKNNDPTSEEEIWIPIRPRILGS